MMGSGECRRGFNGGEAGKGTDQSVRLFMTLWAVAYQAPPSMEFYRQEYCSGLPFPSPGNLPDPGINPWSPALQADALLSEPPGKPVNTKWVEGWGLTQSSCFSALFLLIEYCCFSRAQRPFLSPSRTCLYSTLHAAACFPLSFVSCLHPHPVN